MNNNCDTVLIRHAQSTFNQAIQTTIHKLGISHLTWFQYLQNIQFNRLVLYSQNHIDALLSAKGKQQCQNIVEECEKIKPDLILVSPYRRTMQTCRLLFGNHNSPVIVQPILAQVFRYACEVPEQLHINMKNYSNFDFSKIQRLGNQWFLENLPTQSQQMIKAQIKNARDHGQFQKIILKLIQSKSIHQSPHMLRQRGAKIKQLVKQYRKKYSKIVIIAHFQLLQCIRSKGFNEKHQIIQYQYTKNCHPYYENLDSLLQII